MLFMNTVLECDVLAAAAALCIPNKFSRLGELGWNKVYISSAKKTSRAKYEEIIELNFVEAFCRSGGRNVLRSRHQQHFGV